MIVRKNATPTPVVVNTAKRFRKGFSVHIPTFVVLRKFSPEIRILLINIP
jgi:hypothetical protein